MTLQVEPEQSAREFNEWAKTLRTSPDRLREAVRVVGHEHLYRALVLRVLRAGEK